MKAIKSVGVVILFAIVIYLALGLKKRIVQTTCDAVGNYKATKGEDLLGSESGDIWYCCPSNDTENASDCIYYGD